MVLTQGDTSMVSERQSGDDTDSDDSNNEIMKAQEALGANLHIIPERKKIQIIIQGVN